MGRGRISITIILTSRNEESDIIKKFYFFNNIKTIRYIYALTKKLLNRNY